MIDSSIGSFSQVHEDLIVDSILGYKKNGFYVDVGANHPSLLNNTKRFYDRGWRGVNIEPNPTMFNLLQNERKDDININMGVGNRTGKMNYYLLDPDVLSTFNPKAARKAISSRGAVLKNEQPIRISTLKDILGSLTIDRSIDFMSIDVEGFEKEVIAGGDWQHYRPRLILLEISQRGKELIKIMQGTNYRLVFANGINGIFVDNE